jgi:uncharacterized membrane protein YhhN
VSQASLGVTIIAAASLSLWLHLRAEYSGQRQMVYLFKPLTTSLLLLLAVISTSEHGAHYQLAIVIGLVCSLIGDIFLMLPRDRFVPGLAHVAYLVGFTADVPLGTAPVLALPLLAAAVPLLRLLWPDLGALRLPVLVYAATILLMVWLAWGRSWTLLTPGAMFAAMGATFFVASDGLLALDRFHRPIRQGQSLIMTSYVAAQALIALSVGTG